MLPLTVAAAFSILAGDAPKSGAAVPPPTQVAVKALAFLEKDAAKWRQERGCATCHHGTMTVWALSEAKSQGYAVGSDGLADMVNWTKEQFVPRFSKPRDPRPGWNLVSVPAIYLGIMSQSLPVLSRDEINRVAIHLARHQEEDGAWSAPPAGNGAPPTWESREALALLALLAWEPYVPADAKEADAARASRDKALAWLSKVKPSETTQAVTLRLLVDVRTGKSGPQLQHGIDELLKRQKADGGWSQTKDLPSDAYATGQALYVLSFAGLKLDRPEVQRAVSFLASSQREDGAWAMTSRNHPGVNETRKRNPVPITYFGTAWATLGLVRLVPPVVDTATRQQRAFDDIRRLSGTFERDDKSPDKPVVRVEIRYQLDDEELAGLASRLTAFPQLISLHFKSPKITDAGLAHLKVLAQLRNLSLESAAITDAGLTHLKALTYLEDVNLKGTKVTETGVQDLQKGLPKTKVSR